MPDMKTVSSKAVVMDCPECGGDSTFRGVVGLNAAGEWTRFEHLQCDRCDTWQVG